jgi:putative ABC transport system substrate-binding protein
LELPVLNARSEHDFDAVFTNLIQLRAGGLVVGTDPFFSPEQLAALAVRHAMPAIGETRDFVAAGGLMNYGGNLTDAYLLAGAYVGRVLKGARPGDLAVQQATKVALFVNLKAAKALGLVVPQSLLARAEEVIE